jgi:myo-inositol-1(or 4)-monophosphatase
MTGKSHQLLHTAQEAARLAGHILMKSFGRLKSIQVGLKGMGDYVTDLDHESERAIIETIKRSYPDHLIHAEESGKGHTQSDYTWFIDPLDGTANYVQCIPVYGVSIACMIQKEITIGVIYYPDRDELYWAVKGQGAFMNDHAISVSDKEDMAYSMLASGFPWRSKNFLDPYMASFKDLFLQAAGLRRMGAACIDLAFTACGRFDGFWEMKLQPWDIAAGVLLIEEAGGIVSDFMGERDFLKSGNVVAANKELHSHILQVTQKYLASVH